MVGYYSAHYAFSCVTDHDYISNANAYSTGSFLGVNGVEESDTAKGPHVVGFGMSSLGSFTSAGGLQGHIDSAIANGALPMVAHPNWSATTDGYTNLATLMQNMINCNIINVYNYRCERLSGHNGNSEPLWDGLLTNGKVIYGYAEDDAHGGGDTGYTFNSVGTTNLNLASIKTALQNGNSYFGFTKTKWTQGIAITSYRIGGTKAGDTINITTSGGQTIQFIGHNGDVLSTISSNEARYTITGTEQYVRIKITDAIGDITWTQPVFVTP